MQKDQALGLFMGLFIGDALGAPLEFIPTDQVPYTTEMTGGGVHRVDPGSWTDDGAMAVCLAQAYLTQRKFAPDQIVRNFRHWKKTGCFGTRDYCFDIGITTEKALERCTEEYPYAGSASPMASGNGSIMRLAPVIVANHTHLGLCIGQSVASSLITHGSVETVNYISAFAHEMYEGKPLPEYDLLRQWTTEGSDKGGGSIMYTYATAWKYVSQCPDFESAVVGAVNLGYDADTVGAVTGMIAGRLHGYSNIPGRWLNKLYDHDNLLAMAEALYELGSG